MRVSARARLAIVGLVALLVAACVSPTLPLPPPTAPTISRGSEPDTVKLTSTGGGVQPNALVLVVNQNEERPRDRRVEGTLADDQGAWELEIHALSGDRLDIAQESAAVRSAPTTITVR